MGVKRKAWQPQEVEFLKCAIRDKVSMAVIALMLGREELSIVFKADALKLRRAPPL